MIRPENKFPSLVHHIAVVLSGSIIQLYICLIFYQDLVFFKGRNHYSTLSLYVFIYILNAIIIRIYWLLAHFYPHLIAENCINFTIHHFLKWYLSYCCIGFFIFPLKYVCPKQILNFIFRRQSDLNSLHNHLKSC